MKKQLEIYQKRVFEVLNNFLNNQKECPEYLLDAIRYSTLNNGKRLRPALVYAIAEANKIPLKQVDSLAAGIELIHNYSLVHDDLPALDNDDLRRGKPTCHIQYDEPTAILVGDAQLTYAFELVSFDNSLSDNIKIKSIQVLSQSSGGKGMVGGQVIDIKSEGNLPVLDDLKQMHLLKTGKIIQASLLLGALQAHNFDALSSGLKVLGEKIGLAFQVQDDILDIEGTTEELGKPQGSDQESDKSTYPKLIGLKASKIYRDKLIEEALLELKVLNISSSFLTQLINYIAERKH